MKIRNTDRPNPAVQGAPWWSKRAKKNRRVYDLCRMIPDHDIRESVLRSIPEGRDDVRRCLRRLARHLKSIDPTADVASWRKIVEGWADVSGVGSEAVAEFADHYASANGQAPSAFFVNRVKYQIQKEGGSSEWRVIRCLQLVARAFSNRKFHLSCRLAAECTGVPSATCARILSALAGREIIRVLCPGESNPFRRRAATYHVGPLMALSRPEEDVDQSVRSSLDSPYRPSSSSRPTANRKPKKVIRGCAVTWMEEQESQAREVLFGIPVYQGTQVQGNQGEEEFPYESDKKVDYWESYRDILERRATGTVAPKPEPKPQPDPNRNVIDREPFGAFEGASDYERTLLEHIRRRRMAESTLAPWE